MLYVKYRLSSITGVMRVDSTGPRKLYASAAVKRMQHVDWEGGKKSAVWDLFSTVAYTRPEITVLRHRRPTPDEAGWDAFCLHMIFD